MKLKTSNDGIKHYIEFELRLCKTYKDRRHVNQTCHGNPENCWKNAKDESTVEISIANCLKLYPGWEPNITGKFFEKETAS